MPAAPFLPKTSRAWSFWSSRGSLESPRLLSESSGSCSGRRPLPASSQAFQPFFLKRDIMISSRWRPTGKACVWGGRVGNRTNGVITLLLLGCSCFSLLAQGLEGPGGGSGEQSSAEQCAKADGGMSCSCGAAAGDGVARGPVKQLQATLSEDSPKLDLTCGGAAVSGVPATMVGGDVCPAEADILHCGESNQGASNTLVKLNSVLGTTNAVNWSQDPNTESSNKYMLDVPKDAFPLLDKDFSVGCKDSKNVAVCKVSVAVQARKSTTVGQAVTCAYGSASNDKHQSVTLTPSNNTLTITCGGGGKMVPDDYLTKFCAYGEDPGSCTSQAFTGLLPGFDQSWWVTKVNPAKLTIPADKFPTDEQKFTLGCKYTAADSSGKTREARSKPASPETSICSVDVIITKQPSTTTTTSSTSSASSSVFVAGTSVNAMVGLLFLDVLQAASSLG